MGAQLAGYTRNQRVGYGRAKLDLLEARLIGAT